MDEPGAGRSRWVGVAVVGGLVVAAWLIPLLRQSGPASWRVIFPEDGSIYTHEAIGRGPFSVLFHGYAGYLQLPPRLLAVGVSVVPLRQLTLYFALVGSLTAALLAWFVYWATRDWIASVPLRLLLAAICVLAPVMGHENTANITNTIWVFAAVAPWALVSLREGRGATVVRGVVAFLAATATPLMFLLVPVAIVWIVVRRTRSAMAVGASFAVGLVVQGIVLTHTTYRSNSFLPAGGRVSEFRDRIAYRVFGEVVFGPTWLQSLWRTNWRAVSIAAPLVLVVVLACVFPGAGRRAQVAAATLVAYALVMFVVPLWGRGTRSIRLVEGGQVRPDTLRFSVIPAFFLASALAILIASPERARRSWQRVVGWAFIAQASLLIVVNFSTPTVTSGLRDWSVGVDDAYRTECVGHPPGTIARIPEGLFPVVLPCSSLRP